MAAPRTLPWDASCYEKMNNYGKLGSTALTLRRVRWVTTVRRIPAFGRHGLVVNLVTSGPTVSRFAEIPDSEPPQDAQGSQVLGFDRTAPESRHCLSEVVSYAAAREIVGFLGASAMGDQCPVAMGQ